MFTGLIESIGKVRAIRRLGGEMELTIVPLFQLTGCRVGDSISVDGVCLTVTGVSEESFRMDVSAETVSRSTIGQLRQGDMVNLERALRFTDRLGGHLVSGHVDGTGKILKKEAYEKSWRLMIEIDKELSRYTIEKGSIAVDGISLTVAHLDGATFTVAVVPHTWDATTLPDRVPGDAVNLETDFLVRAVVDTLERWAREDGSSVRLEQALRRSGYLDDPGR